MRFMLPALAFAIAVTTTQAVEAELLPHRAVYDLALIRGGSSVDDARGRIVFEFAGNSCEGYATTVRQVTTLSSSGSSRTLDMSSTTFEEGDGSQFRFRSETRADGTRIKQVDGVARLEDGEMVVDLRRPSETTKIFAQEPAFPVAHLQAIIAAARDGASTLSMNVYDGADDGLQLYDTLAVIGRRMEPAADLPFPGITETARWPVTLSYFEQEQEQGEQTPAYIISFQLHENGVSTDLRLDFGDFVMSGALTTLEVISGGDCP
jgi:hypothetical protein